ncbi:MAG: hypothetical protein ACHQ52_05225, partial [Candidatus Eisenbacteria bacterium]
MALNARVVWFASALAAALVASGLALPPALAAVLLAWTFTVTAGALVTRVLAPGAATADAALLALTLSPRASGGPVAGLRGVRQKPVAAARAGAVGHAVL